MGRPCGHIGCPGALLGPARPSTPFCAQIRSNRPSTRFCAQICDSQNQWIQFLFTPGSPYESGQEAGAVFPQKYNFLQKNVPFSENHDNPIWRPPRVPRDGPRVRNVQGSDLRPLRVCVSTRFAVLESITDDCEGSAQHRDSYRSTRLSRLSEPIALS